LIGASAGAASGKDADPVDERSVLSVFIIPPARSHRPGRAPAPGPGL